jgi:hypothetical protein
MSLCREHSQLDTKAVIGAPLHAPIHERIVEPASVTRPGRGEPPHSRHRSASVCDTQLARHLNETQQTPIMPATAATAETSRPDPTSARDALTLNSPCRSPRHQALGEAECRERADVSLQLMAAKRARCR